MAFGQIQLAQFTETKLPQKPQSAWTGVFEDPKFTGANFKPLMYLGEQPVHGTLYWYIVEETIPYRYEIRHVVKLAILELEGEYKLVKESITDII